MKIGLEVEGRKQGILTLFVDMYRDLIANHDGLNNIQNLHTKHGFSHVYISDHGNRLPLSGDSEILKKLHDLNVSITVERTALYKYEMNKIPHWVDIFLCIQSSSFWWLRPTDQIKFSKNKTVFSEMKGNMVLTNPEDFEKDVEL